MPFPELAVPGDVSRWRELRRAARVVESVVLPEPGIPAMAMR